MLIFQTVNRIIDDLNNYETVVVWGAGPTAQPVIDTLEQNGVEISAIVDSNTELHGTDRYGYKVISVDNLLTYMPAMIIIASFGYEPIANALANYGIDDVYALLDVYKYPLSNMQADYMGLKSFWDEYQCKKTDRILFELYGNIGDVVLRVGIVRRAIEELGVENVWLLFAEDANAQLYRAITDNIIVFSQADCIDDSRRITKLCEINSKYFEKSVVLCDDRIFAQRRILNDYNYNVKQICHHDFLPGDRYLPQLDAEYVCDVFGWSYNTSMLGWNNYDTVQLHKVVGQRIQIPSEPYVTIHIGASRAIRKYNVTDMVPVVSYIRAKGFKIAFVGAGDDSVVHGEGIYDYVGKLSLLETTELISHSVFFVGTDSGLWNVSYVCGIPSVVIYGGGEYGNFKHPVGKVYFASVDKMDCFQCKWYCDKSDKNGVAACIYSITPDNICQKIDELLAEL